MAVTAEQAHEEPARRGRVWLCVPAGGLALVLMLPTVLFAQPRVFYFGGQVVVIRSDPARTFGPPHGPFYWHHRDVPGPARPGTSIEGLRDGRLFYVDGSSRVRGLSIGGRMFAVGWFKGRRIR
jgi:hypothetical protein